MDFKDILEMIAKAAQKRETVKIYYPKTESTPEGWREIEPYSISTDVGPEGEHIVYGKERVEPGHILNAFTLGNKNIHCHSFILGKIKKTELTGKKFTPRKSWKIEF